MQDIYVVLVLSDASNMQCSLVHTDMASISTDIYFSFSACSYRFTLDDLYPMMNAVKQRAENYDEWASHVTETLEAKLDKKKSER